MAEPADLLRASEAAIRELAGVTGSLISGPAELAGPLAAPLQRQTELLQEILQHQLDFERMIAGRLLAPAKVILDVADQTGAAMQEQTKAFRAAASSFTTVADLLERQAELLGSARGAVAEVVSGLRAAGAVTDVLTGQGANGGT